MDGCIVPRNLTGDGSFIQQGSLDWVALSKSSLNATVEVLERISKAVIDILTVAVVQSLCAKFRLPLDAQQRLNDALSKLKAFSSYGNIIWFGFWRETRPP